MRVFSLIILLIYMGSEFFFQQGSHQSLVYLFFLWLASAFLCLEWRVVSLLSQKKYIFIYIFLIFYFLSTLIGSNVYKAFTTTLFMVRVFSPVLMYDILKYETRKIKNLVAFVIMAYVLVYAVMANNMIQIVGVESGLRGENYRQGADTYFETMFAFIYILPVLITTLVSIVKDIKKKTIKNAILIKIVLIMAVVYLFILSLRSLFMTAIVLSIIGVIIAIIYSKGKPWPNLFFKISIAIVAVIVVFLMSFSRIQEIAEKSGSKDVVQRVEEIRGVITGNLSKSSDVASRNDLRTVSIETFFSSPIYGVNHKLVGRVDERMVGNHAQWVDDLARYGIFAILMFIFVIKALKEQYHTTKNPLPILFYITIGFLNPLLTPVSSINIFILVPFLIEMFNNHELANRVITT